MQRTILPDSGKSVSEAGGGGGGGLPSAGDDALEFDGEKVEM
jgi:hypothetical protein